MQSVATFGMRCLKVCAFKVYEPLVEASKLYDRGSASLLLEVGDSGNRGIGENLRFTQLPQFMWAIEHAVPVRLSSIYAPYLCSLANVTH